MLIGICDDSQKDAELIQDYCIDFLKDNKIDYSFLLFTSGEELLCYQNANGIIDLLFLDIEMGSINGIQVKEKLEFKNSVRKIIFVTSHDQMMSEAFGMDVMGFIQKPIQRKDFDYYLSKFCNYYQQSRIINVNASESVLTENILYLEGDRSYSKFYTKTRVFVSSNNLLYWENNLKTKYMVRVHKSYIVNLNHINRIKDRSIILLADDHSSILIPIGRAYTKTFRQQYNQYFLWNDTEIGGRA